MSNDSLLKEDYLQIEYRKFFNQNKNLSYHIAYSGLKDEDKAEAIVEEAMIRIRDLSLFDKEIGFKDKKAILVILTKYMTFSELIKQGNSSAGEKDSDFFLNYDRSAEISAYIDLMEAMPIKDRLVLLLSLNYRMDDGQISHLLYIKKSSIENRRSRALSYMSAKLNKKEDELLADYNLHKASHIWLEGKISSMEAVSNMDPHYFREDMEERVLSSMEKKPIPILIYLKYFPGKYRILMPILLAMALILTLMLAKEFKSDKDQAELKKAGGGSLAEGIGKNESRQEIKETRYVTNENAAYYEDRILFIDATDNKLYNLNKDSSPNLITDLSALIDEHFGVQHIAYMNDAIYLALLDGKGAIITGNPANIKIERYWQTSWFDNQLDKSPLKRTVKDGIEYIFGAEKPLESE